MVANPTPAQAQTRAVLCHHCNRSIDVSVGAMTVNCRHCNRRVVLEDLTIKAYHAALKVETAGRIEVLGKAQLVAEIRVNELQVLGKIKGNVTCVGSVRLGKKAETIGNISCRSMVVEAGATLDGFMNIDPQFTPTAVSDGAEDFVLREDAAELTRTGDRQVPPTALSAERDSDEEDTLLRPELRKQTAQKKKAKKKAGKQADSGSAPSLEA